MADTRIDELRRRLERDPGSRLFAQLAEELRKNGELVEAVRVARAGLAVHTAYPSARLTLGRALLDSGDFSGARAELESALREAPDNILASRYLAQARESLGDLKGAVDQYRKTLVMAPGDRQLQVSLAAVEARVATPEGGTAAGAETTLPMPRLTPPPLPPPLAPGVPSPARPMAPPAPQPPAASGELTPTLRIGSAQTVIPPPQPSAVPASAPAAPPAQEPTTLPVGARAFTAAGGPAGDVAPSEAGAPFSSPTLAELYYQQGLVERAVDVYRQVVQQEPENDKARIRLSELEEAAAPQERAARRLVLERTIGGLETLLAAVRRR